MYSLYIKMNNKERYKKQTKDIIFLSTLWMSKKIL